VARNSPDVPVPLSKIKLDAEITFSSAVARDRWLAKMRNRST